MNDRELLEAAAKAAGISYLADRPTEDYLMIVTDEQAGNVGRWNPLHDDGDALRLAVTVGLSIRTRPYMVEVSNLDGKQLVAEEVICDGFAATRRAIVRAAAALAPRP